MTPRWRVAALGSLVVAAGVIAIIAVLRPPSGDTTIDDRIASETPLTIEAATPTASPVGRSSPSAGPKNAPTEVLGVPVISVSQALARLEGEFDDTELAVRGWYVPPPTMIVCTNAPADANPLRQYCSTGSRWLMDSPEQLEDPTSGKWRSPAGPALTPVIPEGVQFPLGNPGFESPDLPMPVVVLGHFADRRDHSFGAARRFVVDSLVWRDGTPIPPGGVIEFISRVETTADVAKRIERDLGPTRAMWFRLVTPHELEATDPDAVAHIPDLNTAAAVWVATRLVEEDGRGVVRTAFTVEGSDRVWTDEHGISFVLKTTINIDLGAGGVLQVVDIADDIRAVRPADLAGAASWVTRDGPPETGPISLGVIAERPNELRVSWRGGDCDQAWQLDWGEERNLLLRPIDPLIACESRRLEIVMTLDHPVVLESVVVIDNMSGG